MFFKPKIDGMEIIMKKILAALLLLVTLTSLFACGTKYKPVKSTKEESKVVMTVSAGGKSYDVRYELYRAFFLNNRDQVDGGDRSVWSGADAEKYISRINNLIADDVATIYSTLHFAESLGIDPYSKKFEESITEYVRIGVEGNGEVTGHGGDYEAYLASLKEMNLNYSVSVLLIRYQLALEAINEYYSGRVDEVLGNLGSEYEVKAEDVRSYYFGEECARVLHLFYQEGVKSDLELENARAAIAGADSDLSVALYIINNSMGLESELIKDKKVTGSIVGKYALDSDYYSDYAEAAFSLSVGETSDVIRVKGENPGAYVIYKLDKTEEHFNDNYSVIRSSYIDNLVGKRLSEIKRDMTGSVSYTAKYDEINHSSVSMD